MRAILALLCLVAVAPPARAEAKLSQLEVSLDGNQVLASLALMGAFSHRFVERIESGLPTSIVYRFELNRDRRNWWDQRLQSATLEVVALHDAEARTYTIHWKLEGKLIESRTVRDLKALEAEMSHLERLPVFTLGATPDRRRMRIKVRAELGTRTALSFIPVTIATDWVESVKFRALRPGAPPQS